MFKNRVPRKTFGSNGDEVTQDKKLAEHKEHMGERKKST
jgi:hypothetical protein